MLLLKRYLRPAGDKILLRQGDPGQALFSEYKYRFYQSGTAALAAAIMAAIHCRRPASTPEVLLPAYGCPDLVSAAVYAGAKPVLIDLEPDSTWMSISDIQQRITENTVAVIAVNFLGIRERTDKLRDICQKYNLLLIEDSAQAFPDHAVSDFWHGDINIISFARGKPVNMLTGGAVLYKQAEIESKLPIPIPQQEKLADDLIYQAKVFLYNGLLSPELYNLVQQIPFTHIGETRYKPLPGIYSIPIPAFTRLSTNIDFYKRKKNIENDYEKMLRAFDESKYSLLEKFFPGNRECRLLRFPVLIHDKSNRNRIANRLKAYGVSTMYQRALPAIDGVAGLISNHSDIFPQAENFSDKLLTLPLHGDVTAKDIATISSILKHYLA